MNKLLVASHNQGKVRELRELLEPFNIETVSAAEFDLPEPEETETTFAGNATLTTGNLTVGGTGNFTGVVTGPSTDTLLIKDSAGSTLKTIRGV